MNLITIDQLRSHCKADGDDDDVLVICGNGAEAACASLCNRNLYADDAELLAAKVAAVAANTAAWATYDAAVVAAEAVSDERVRVVLIENARYELQSVTNEMERTLAGLVVNDEQNSELIDAVLLIAGHFYINREEVVSGNGAAAVPVPLGAQALCNMKRYQGRLI